MNVLIIKNISHEGPGTIGDYLQEKNIAHSLVDLQKGDAAPDITPFTHLVIMGGPMAVYEMHRYPHLINEALLISAALKANKHILGVCLGAQMLAHMLGARVYPGLHKEIGWYDVALTQEGMQDPLLSWLKLPGKDAAQVFQWHGDTFDLPRGSVRLASSELFPNQAFRYMDRVYALQFHIEVTPTIVHDWLKNEKGIDFVGITATSARIFDEYHERAQTFYQAFFHA